VLLRETLWSALQTGSNGLLTGAEVPRRLTTQLHLRAGRALVLTGVRRCGKSTLQAQLSRQANSAAVFCNLEDTRLYGMEPRDFPTLLSLLDENYPDAAVFLDEVQEVGEWQRLVRALLDAGRRVCVTGSNASLLGRELGAKLTGRHLSVAVYPFSYSEYLELRRAERGAETLKAYLAEGGFPAAIREPELAPVLLRELLRDVVQRDIVSRFALRDTRHLMNLALHLLAHTGQPLSLQSLAKGLSIPSVAQAGRYLEYLRDAWLILPVPRFSSSFKRRVISPPKYYAIDPGFQAANTPNPTPDLGRRLENGVLLALLRGGEEVAFAAETHVWECDFVSSKAAIQVCANLSPQNREREVRGLLGAANLPSSHRQVRDLLILTIDQRDVFTEGGRMINVLPAWEWLD
jgi:uncharacterized protein